MPALAPSRLPRPSQAAPGAFPGWPFIDTRYDYTSILAPGSEIATLPAGKAGTSVAVVGAGVAGTCAGYELLRMGLSPMIFEASERVGGRTWSEPFEGTELFAEMGAMRVPPSSKVFWTYADRFGIQGITFPDPGKVLTTLYVENEQLTWEPNQKPPGRFVAMHRQGEMTGVAGRRIARSYGRFVFGIDWPWRAPRMPMYPFGTRARVAISGAAILLSLSRLGGGFALSVPEWSRNSRAIEEIRRSGDDSVGPRRAGEIDDPSCEG